MQCYHFTMQLNRLNPALVNGESVIACHFNFLRSCKQVKRSVVVTIYTDSNDGRCAPQNVDSARESAAPAS